MGGEQARVQEGGFGGEGVVVKYSRGASWGGRGQGHRHTQTQTHTDGSTPKTPTQAERWVWLAWSTMVWARETRACQRTGAV